MVIIDITIRMPEAINARHPTCRFVENQNMQAQWYNLQKLRIHFIILLSCF